MNIRSSLLAGVMVVTGMVAPSYSFAAVAFAEAEARLQIGIGVSYPDYYGAPPSELPFAQVSDANKPYFVQTSAKPGASFTQSDSINLTIGQEDCSTPCFTQQNMLIDLKNYATATALHSDALSREIHNDFGKSDILLASFTAPESGFWSFLQFGYYFDGYGDGAAGGWGQSDIVFDLWGESSDALNPLYRSFKINEHAAPGSAPLSGWAASGILELAPGTTYNVYLRDLFVQAYAVVPEPATWGLMILGFGLSGMAMRGRRAVAHQRV